MSYLTEAETVEHRERVAVGLLPHLAGGPWAWEPGGAGHYGLMKRLRDGLGLVVSLDTYKRRVRFRVEGPPRKVSYGRTLRDYGVIPYGEPEPACTVAWDRPGHAVAADIQRRVLAVADPLWPLVLRKAEEEAERYVERDRAVASLVRLTNAGVYDRGGDNRSVCAQVGGVSLPMEVGPGGNVSLRQLHLTRAQMEAVILALRGVPQEQEA